jgi:hypothetical protein
VRPVECNFDFKPYFYGAQAETVNVLAELAFFLRQYLSKHWLLKLYILVYQDISKNAITIYVLHYPSCFACAVRVLMWESTD